jgi:CRP-like cAMP-binding protein
MAQRADDTVDVLAGFALFSDLDRPQLESVAHTLEEEWFSPGQRVLRQGFTGTGLYFILQGEAAVLIDGRERARLGRGEFFGEVSVLLGDPPVADIVAATPLHCLVLGVADVEPFLTSHPKLMYRMLQTQARRLRNANLWQG